MHKILGQGQFGTTRLVVDKKTGERLAMKSISKRKLTAPEDIADVQREIQVGGGWGVLVPGWLVGDAYVGGWVAGWVSGWVGRQLCFHGSIGVGASPKKRPACCTLLPYGARVAAGQA